MPLWRPSAPESLHLSRPRILAACKSSKMCPLSLLRLHCEASSWASGRFGEACLRSQRRGGGQIPRSHPLKLLVNALYKHPWSASSRPSPSPRADFGTCHLDSLAARRYFYIEAGGPGVYLPHPLSLDPELGFQDRVCLGNFAPQGGRRAVLSPQGTAGSTERVTWIPSGDAPLAVFRHHVL